MQVVILAQEEARACGHTWVGTEHLLVGLTSVPMCIASEVLSSHAELSRLRKILRETRPRALKDNKLELPFSQNAKAAFEQAWYMSAERLELITSAHVLAGLCAVRSSTACQLLKQLDCDPVHLEELALHRVTLSAKFRSVHLSLFDKVMTQAGLKSVPTLEVTELPQHLIKPSLNATAAKLMQKREFVVAEKLLTEALQLNPNTDRVGHAVTLSGLGYIYLERSDFAKAETMFRQALDMRRELQMDMSAPDTVALALNNLGFAVHWQNRFREARKYYQQALDMIFEQHRLDLEAILANNLGDAERALKDYDHARELLLNEEYPQYPSENYQMYRMYYRARLYRDTGETELAEREYAKCLELAKPLRGPAHIKTAVTEEYAQFLEAQGKPIDAQRVRAQ